jgi:hypothetical protein
VDHFAGGSHFDFPVSFSIGGSTSLVGDSLRSCSTSLWQQHVQSVEVVLGLVWSGRKTHFRLRLCVICRRLMVLICYRTILHRALQFTS